MLVQRTEVEAFDLVRNVTELNLTGCDACTRFVCGQPAKTSVHLISAPSSNVKKLGDIMSMGDEWETNVRQLEVEVKHD